MANIQSNINRLLALGAGISKLSSMKKPDVDTEMSDIQKSTAKEKLKNIKLKNKHLRMKNRALSNMQDKGLSKVDSKNDFNTFLSDLRSQGVSENYINKNPEIIKQKFEGLKK